MKKKLILKKINLFLFENKNVEKFKLKFKYSKNISIFELKEFFIFYPNLKDISVKNKKLIFKFNLTNNSIMQDTQSDSFNYEEIKNPYLKKFVNKEPIIEEASSILNISYEESLLLKDIIESILMENKELIINDSLINSFSYIFKQRLIKEIDNHLIINFLKFLNLTILEKN
jgi:hypothetical protein